MNSNFKDISIIVKEAKRNVNRIRSVNNQYKLVRISSNKYNRFKKDTLQIYLVSFTYKGQKSSLIFKQYKNKNIQIDKPNNMNTADYNYLVNYITNKLK